MMNRREFLAGAASFVASPAAAGVEPWAAKLITAAESQVGRTVLYDPAYAQIGYPGGDIPIERGVCTDLQKLVHEDMRANFAAYPKNWGLMKPDSNIDHRRVPNLQTFFKRRSAALPAARVAEDYLPGDLVTMELPGNLPHIVVVTHRRSNEYRPLCVHNIGAGARLEDVLFEFPLTGHYRFRGV
jgi:uncharacterized protein